METPDECVRRCSMESRSKCDHTNDSRNAANSVLRPQTTRELVSAADDTRISAVTHNKTLQRYACMGHSPMEIPKERTRFLRSPRGSLCKIIPNQVAGPKSGDNKSRRAIERAANYPATRTSQPPPPSLRARADKYSINAVTYGGLN